MPIGYQIVNQDETYFLTFTVINWIDVFSRQRYRDIIIESLKFCQQNKGLEVYAFVIMTNHIHLVVRCPNGNLSATIRDFKSYTAKKILESIAEGPESRNEWMLKMFNFAAARNKRNEKLQFWMQDNHAEVLNSNYFIDEKIDYIHNNPVKAGIVEKAEDYLYSSARAYAGIECVLDVILAE